MDYENGSFRFLLSARFEIFKNSLAENKWIQRKIRIYCAEKMRDEERRGLSAVWHANEFPSGPSTSRAESICAAVWRCSAFWFHRFESLFLSLLTHSEPGSTSRISVVKKGWRTWLSNDKETIARLWTEKLRSSQATPLCLKSICWSRSRLSGQTDTSEIHSVLLHSFQFRL